MKKARILSIIMLVCVMTSFLSVAATAANYSGATNIVPMSEGTCTVRPTIDITSLGKATCSCTVNIKSGYTANLQINLCKLDGNTWTPIKGWSANNASGNATYSNSYYVTSGESYRVSVTVSVYNSSGNFVETVTANSGTKKY